jgi:oligopeptide/dipeptide ABC transporter ATP-binding protein
VALLEVRELALHYDAPTGPVRAVDGVSFTLPAPGQALGVIGETGSGKTSILLALTRMLPPNVCHFSGEVLLQGAEISRLPAETFRREVRWKRIAMVFQGAQNGFNPVVRIGEQVMERSRADGEVDARGARAKARELLASVGLPAGTAERYPHELSGGMKQRAAIAMALTMRPELLLLDEPTSALDVSVQAQIMNLLKKLKAEMGLSMLFISHDIALASDLCDRFVVMSRGTVREEGSAEQVLGEPQDEYTRQLLASVPVLRTPGHPSPAPGPAAGAGDPLVEVRDLSVHFSVAAGFFRSRVVRAVDGVSLSIHRGETVALVGESGSGKTTLGRALLRLVRPAAGTVRFAGVDIAGLQGETLKQLRRRAQAVFQDPYASISPFMDVRTIVEEPLEVHGVRARAGRSESVLHALESVRLTPASDVAMKHPHTLSGGQRQRVCIARAIVLGPELVVADEPVSMVDASNRVEILRLLRDLQAEKGIAFLYITHDLASARQVAKRIAVMYLGTLVEEGPAGAVIDTPAHPYARALLAAVPEPDPANRHRMRDVIPGEPPRADAVPPGCPFHPRCPKFMKGRCDVERPIPREIDPGHRVACFLYD